MHLVVVDSNPAGLVALERATAMGHRVTFVQSPAPLYVGTPAELAAVAAVDELRDGVNTFDPEEVTRVLADVHAAHPVDVVVTLHEIAAEAVAIACRALGLRGTSPEGVLTARNKDRARAALARAGLPSARFAVAHSADDAVAAAGSIGWPVVLKPPSGADSLLSFTATGPEEAREAARQILDGAGTVPQRWRPQFRRGVLVEEYLVGTLVSVELGVRDGRCYPFSVTGRFRWAEDEVVELGSFIPAALPDATAAECVAYAESVCRALGLDLGLFHLEIMVTDDGPRLVEANPRVMGGALPTIYELATGLNIYDGLLQVLDPDAEVVVPPRPSRTVGGRKVMSREPGTIDAHARLDWMLDRSEVLGVVGFDTYGTGPGRRVEAGDVIARFLVAGADYSSVVVAAEDLLQRLESVTGLRFRYGEKG